MQLLYPEHLGVNSATERILSAITACKDLQPVVTAPSYLTAVQLNVVVPGSPSPTPGGGQSSPGAAEAQAAAGASTDGGAAAPGSAGTRVLAVLRRGDACGEAALLVGDRDSYGDDRTGE
jgi:hypothetical protein